MPDPVDEPTVRGDGELPLQDDQLRLAAHATVLAVPGVERIEVSLDQAVRQLLPSALREVATPPTGVRIRAREGSSDAEVDIRVAAGRSAYDVAREVRTALTRLLEQDGRPVGTVTVAVLGLGDQPAPGPEPTAPSPAPTP